jgi:Fic family protein
LSLLSYLDTPSYGRAKTSYQAELIENYIPNETQYVSNTIREQLYKSGKRLDITLAAGTYAKHIGQRLLIDLSYHSSRLEGNTYSKLDTKKFIENGLTAEGKAHEETVMIMNHKEAILFLVENAEELSLSLFTIRNIHYLLSQDLLRNPNACGKIRQIEVRVGKSAYLPLNNSHQLESHFALLLRKAEQITDPFEQSFFLLMHISYLQAFEDVNKRTARLSCNIPFIKENLCPLSFIDVPQKDYFAVLIYFYEKNDLQPALELFQWAYIKSCEQYDVVKESLGEIDTYRIQYRSARKEIMGKIIRQGISHSNIESAIAVYCRANSIDSPDKFITMTMQDLENLHVGAIIGLGITESMYASWKAKNSIQK